MSQPVELRILDAFLERCNDVQRGKDPTWLNSVKSVGYGPLVKDAVVKTPALFAEIAFWRESFAFGGSAGPRLNHESEMDIRFTGYVNNTKEAQVAVVDLFHDMKRVVHETLTRPILSGIVLYMWLVDAEIGTEKYQQSGRGTVIMTVRVLYRWSNVPT